MDLLTMGNCLFTQKVPEKIDLGSQWKTEMVQHFWTFTVDLIPVTNNTVANRLWGKNSKKLRSLKFTNRFPVVFSIFYFFCYIKGCDYSVNLFNSDKMVDVAAEAEWLSPCSCSTARQHKHQLFFASKTKWIYLYTVRLCCIIEWPEI